MTIELTPFPVVPESRTALTSAGIRQYITSPAYTNFQNIETLLESIEATVAALPTTVSSAVMPDAAGLYDFWIDESAGNQLKFCNDSYTSGNGTAGKWTSVTDSAATALATEAYGLAQDAQADIGSDFPSAYTENWIFVNSVTGVIYICNESYTAALPSGERAGKFTSVVDETSAAAITSIQANIANFASDNIISAIEKRALQREWSQIEDNKSLSTTLATTLGKLASSEYVAMDAAYEALDTYLNTTLDVFADMGSDTSLSSFSTTRSIWNTTWKNWYAANKTFIDFISTELNTDIDNVQDDETITKSESREAYLRWQYEVKNYAQHDATTDALDSAGIINKSTDADWAAYYEAYNALNTYLNTTLDLFAYDDWPLLLSAKSSDATEWKAKWQALTDAERDLSQLTNTSFANQIDSLADDGTISAGGEKILATQGWGAIYGTDGTDGEYGLLISRADSLIASGNTSLTSPKNSLESAYGSLKSYLDGLTDFYTTTVNTSVDNTTWDARWNLYFTKFSALDKASSDISDTSLGIISGFVNDETITVGKEKQELIEVFDRITNEKNKMLVRATIGIGTDTTAYVAAYDALKAYLYGLFTGGDAAAFNSTIIGAVSINRSVWKQKFDDYYNAREDLQTNIVSGNISNLSVDSAAIPSMALDGTISSEEKYVALQYWTVIYGDSDNAEHAAMYTQATNLGVTASYITDFDDAYTILANYLNDGSFGSPASIPPVLNLFDDMGVSKTLDSPQQTYWQTYWSNYYAKRDILRQQIQTELQADLNSKLDLTGGTMSGNIAMTSGATVTGLPASAGAGQAVRHEQLTSILAGTTAFTGNADLGNNKAVNVSDGTVTSGGKEAVNGGQLYAHTSIVTGNPHGVTKANVGLSNVTDNAQVAKDTATTQTIIADFQISKSDPVLDINSTGGHPGYLRVSTNGTPDAILQKSTSGQYWEINPVDANTGLAMGATRIINVKDPASAQDAATKNYVDNYVNNYVDTGIAVLSESGDSPDTYTDIILSNVNLAGYEGFLIINCSNDNINYDITMMKSKTSSEGYWEYSCIATDNNGGNNFRSAGNVTLSSDGSSTVLTLTFTISSVSRNVIISRSGNSTIRVNRSSGMTAGTVTGNNIQGWVR